MAPENALSETHECHLWALPPEKARVEHLCEEGLGLLSDEESSRHQAMRNPLAAKRFLVGRCLLRRGLAEHLRVSPGELRFNRQTKGKLDLVSPEVKDLHFSLSHSDEETVLVIARCCALGIDLEAQSRGAKVLRIAQHYYPLAERQQISARPEGREKAALTHWTLKESVIKAVGGSVWDALTSVCLDTSGPNLGWLRPPPVGDAKSWALLVGPFRKRHVIALALRTESDWSGKLLQFHNHVLGQGKTEGRIFFPETKTRHPKFRQAAR